MTIRVGLVGAGIMGSDHARILTTTVSGTELVAVSDPDAGRTAAVAAMSGARVVRDPHEIIRDADVDAVLVASPDPTHAELVLACLDVGKPVLCEKPLAPTIEDCLAIVEREARLGRRLVTVGFMRRFDAGYVAMKRQLDEGSLGAALIFHCIHRNLASLGLTSDSPIAGSAVHEFDICRWMLGAEVDEITVVKPRKSRLTEAQDPQIVLLTMTDGVVVDIELLIHATYGYDVRAELVGEQGTVSLIPPVDVLTRRGAMESTAVPADWRPRFAGAYRAELQAWIAAIRDGTQAGASAWDGYAATAIAEAGLRALRSGKSEGVSLKARPRLYDQEPTAR